MDNQCTSREQELYRLLWEIFAPFGRGLDMDRQTALDGADPNAIQEDDSVLRATLANELWQAKAERSYTTKP